MIAVAVLLLIGLVLGFYYARITQPPCRACWERECLEARMKAKVMAQAQGPEQQPSTRYPA